MSVCFTVKGVDELRTIAQIHQSFISSENPESVYVLYGKRGPGTGYISHSVLVHNSHPEPLDGFQVRRHDLDEASAHLLTAEPALVPLGVIHTHEDAALPAPSDADVREIVPGYIHLVLCPRYKTYVVYDQSGELDQYQLTDHDLVNRQGESLCLKMFDTTTEGSDT